MNGTRTTWLLYNMDVIVSTHLRSAAVATLLFTVALFFSYPAHSNVCGVAALGAASFVITSSLVVVHLTKWGNQSTPRRTAAIHMLFLFTVFQMCATAFYALSTAMNTSKAAFHSPVSIVFQIVLAL